MRHFQVASIDLKRFGFAVALAASLGLGSLTGQAQTAPAAKLKPDYYYLNGKLSTKEEVEKLDPKTIARLDVLSGEQAIAYTHDAKAKSAVLVQTK